MGNLAPSETAESGFAQRRMTAIYSQPFLSSTADPAVWRCCNSRFCCLCISRWIMGIKLRLSAMLR